MSHNDEQLRNLASWLPGFQELEQVEDQVEDLWRQLKALRTRAKEIKERLVAGCPLDLDELEFRYWSKVGVVDDDDSCWEWTRSRNPKPDNYGTFRWKPPDAEASTIMSASRVALFLSNGALPEVGCHRCDNPPCCRPKHLYDGTHLDNMRDRREHGRYVVASRLKEQNRTRNTQAKLTDALVIHARDLARSGKTLPQIHAEIKSPASETVLRWAITGRTWKHLNEQCAPVVKARNGSAIKGKRVSHRPRADRAFTNEQIREIRWARSASNPEREKLRVIADRYGVSLGMISSIEHRRSYAHVTDQEES